MSWKPEQHLPVRVDNLSDKQRKEPITRTITRTVFVENHGNFPGQTHYTLWSANRNIRNKDYNIYEQRIIGEAKVRPYSVLKRKLSFEEFLDGLFQIVGTLNDIYLEEDELTDEEIEILKQKAGEFNEE